MRILFYNNLETYEDIIQQFSTFESVPFLINSRLHFEKSSSLSFCRTGSMHNMLQKHSVSLKTCFKTSQKV